LNTSPGNFKTTRKCAAHRLRVSRRLNLLLVWNWIWLALRKKVFLAHIYAMVQTTLQL